MMLFEKKILPLYFAAVLCGEKTFELREEDDCHYNVKDHILLKEWTKERGETGRFCEVEVVYILRDHPGLADGWCIMSIRPVLTTPATTPVAWWQDDFAELKNGNKPDMAFRCTNCGHRAGKYKHKTYKHCPWCGAYMIGDAYVAERSKQTTITD